MPSTRRLRRSGMIDVLHSNGHALDTGRNAPRFIITSERIVRGGLEGKQAEIKVRGRCRSHTDGIIATWGTNPERKRRDARILRGNLASRRLRLGLVVQRR